MAKSNHRISSALSLVFIDGPGAPTTTTQERRCAGAIFHFAAKARTLPLKLVSLSEKNENRASSLQ